MKPTIDRSFASAAGLAGSFAFLTLAALASCSTVKSISPFTSGVPYAQDVQPTVPRPASPEIPVYKKTAPTEAAPVAEAPPQPASPAPPPPAPAPAEPKASPSATPAPAPAPQASAPPAAAPSAPPSQTGTSTAEEANTQPAASGPTKGNDTKDNDKPPPTIPADRMAYNDNGQYRNLAEVPARPKGLPTFADARATEAALVADRGGTPVPPAAAPKAGSGIALENHGPCSASAAAAKPAATLRFDAGSTTLPSDQRGILSDALPSVRDGTGAIRVVGHGNSEAGAGQGPARFDLAMGRASAVAQALAEFGIPAQRIAVQVGCDENPQAGGSVQLYASS